MRTGLIWAGLILALAVPLVFALSSPLLAWRDPIYIAAGIAGVIGMALILVQPLLAGGLLPNISDARARKMHRWSGGLLLGSVLAHVIGLWVTSPPDVVDALFFVSPTPFSAWGVVAMWAVFAASLLAALRLRLRLRPKVWRLIHTVLVSVIALGTIVHAVLIQGTMESVSKGVLALLIFGVLVKVIWDRRVWVGILRR